VTKTLLKKTLLFILLASCLAALTLAGWTLVIIHELPDVSSLAGPGVSLTIKVRDWDGNSVPFTVGSSNPFWTPLEDIPFFLRDAVLAGEDFSFYSHNGVDWYEVYESFKRNFREHRISRGASTITQQLAKNLFLSREKTVRRKIKELILASRLEKALTKDRILELYLNVVELGDTVYGVGAGARHHFGKKPSELSLRESAFLAAMLPGPKVYDPDHNMDRVMNRSDHLLGVMLKGRKITEDQYMEALVEIPFPYRDVENLAAEENTGKPAPYQTRETEEAALTQDTGLVGEVNDTSALSPMEGDGGTVPWTPDQALEPAESVSTGDAGLDRAVSDTTAFFPPEGVSEKVDPSGSEGIVEIPIKSN
jgi:monofunctional biosynthetic peptidoglycan transglycosylase